MTHFFQKLDKNQSALKKDKKHPQKKKTKQEQATHVAFLKTIISP